MQLINRYRWVFGYLCTIVCCSACSMLPERTAIADHDLLADYRFYPPCGHPCISGDLSGKTTGYYFVYVLQDSLTVRDCVSTVTEAPRPDSFPMRFGRDFLLAMEVREAKREWFFELQNMEVVDSMLHIHLRAHHRSDTMVAMPRYALSDNYVWRVNGHNTKLIKIFISNANYAYVPGPRWSGMPVNWRHAHWKETPAN